MSDILRLISAADTALTVERALTVGDEPSAIRHLTEAVSRLIQAPRGAEIPDAVLEVPHQIEDVRYRTLIATAFAYAMVRRGRTPLAWMTDVKPLESEWLWGSDGGEAPEFRDLMRSQTPDIFRRKNILTRGRDWVAA